MGLLNKFVDRENPFLIQFALLTVVGFWHVDSDKKWVRYIYAGYKFFTLLVLTSFIFIEIIDVINLREDSSRMAERLCAASITGVITIKTHMMLHLTEEYYDLQRKLNQFRKMRSDKPEDLKIIKKASKYIVKSAKFFYVSAFLAVSFWMAHPRLYEGRKLPFPVTLPLDMEKSPNYEILYVSLSIVLIMFTASAVATILGYGSYMTLMIAHFDVVKRNLETIFGEREEAVRRERFLAEFNRGRYTPERNQTLTEREEEEKRIKDGKTMEILRDAIVTLNFIYNEVDSFKRLQSDYLMVHIMAVIFGVAVVETTGLSDAFTVHMFKRLLILGLAIVDIFTVCFFGEELEHKSCEISETLYLVPWHEMNLNLRKMVSLMMTRSQKPCILKAGNTIPLNLATYLNIMRVAYNFMLLLRHTVSN